MPSPSTSPVSQPSVATLDALRQQHAALLNQVPDENMNDQQLALVADFLQEAAAVGKYLDLPEEREAAQGLLDYWKATLYTQKRNKQASRSAFDAGEKVRLEAAVLADFDDDALADLAARAEQCVASLEQQDPAYGELARDVLLRLVHGSEGGGFVLATVSRTALLEGLDREKTMHVLAALEQAGVLATEPGSGPEHALLRLRYEALTRAWPRLAGWLEKRLLFSDAARFWDKHNRDRGALFTGTLLDEARNYKDTNPLEKEFIDACRAEADRLARQRTRQVWQWRAVAAAIAILLLVTIMMWRAERNQRRIVIKQNKMLEEQTVELDNQLKEIRKQRDAHLIISMSDLLSSVGRVGAATSDAERKLANRELQVLLARAQRDVDLRQLTGVNEDVVRKVWSEPRASPYEQTAPYKSLKAGLLDMAHTVRNNLLASDRPEAISQLKELRKEYYGTVRLVAEELVRAAEEGQSWAEVRPLRQEFWRFYWGEMGLVEGKDVEGAMVKFDTALNQWEQWQAEQEARSPDERGRPESEKRRKDLLKKLADAKENLLKQLKKELDSGELLPWP